MTTMTTPGAALIEALVAGRTDTAGDLLAPDVTFSALVPSKLIEQTGRDATLAVLSEWFPRDAVWLEHLDTGAIGDRERVGYRVRCGTETDGFQVFEQQAYYGVGEDGITAIRLVCSGDHAV